MAGSCVWYVQTKQADIRIYDAVAAPLRSANKSLMRIAATKSLRYYTGERRDIHRNGARIALISIC